MRMGIAVVRGCRRGVLRQQRRCTAANCAVACYLVTLCAVGLGGCRGETRQRMALEGTATVDGKPLNDGDIRLLSVNGADAMIVGGSITGGHFNIPAKEGAWPGNYRVEIRAFRRSGRPAQQQSMRQIDDAVQFLPNRYNLQSELTAEVTAAGPNRFDFALRLR
jgi:hypothetical protein